MDIRKQIIQELNFNTEYKGNYEKLQYSLQLPEAADNWFKGIIESLYYKPNHTVLILEGKQGIGKTEFFRRLMPGTEPCWFTDSSDMESAWKYIIWNFEFHKRTLEFPLSDGFRINEPEGYEQYPHTDKRLTSFCGTTNKWQFPQRKNFIVHKVDWIDWELFNSIDKLELWREIFQMFKPLR